VHFVENPETIPQIINAEVRSKDDLAIQERPCAPSASGRWNLSTHRFRPLAAFAGLRQGGSEGVRKRFLRVDIDKPLLVRWRYGLGRVIAFMFRRKSRWAASWGSLDALRNAVAANGA